MKGHRIYHLLILIVINSALGSEDWPSEREKVLGRFTRIHRDFRELNMTLKTEKENVMTQIEDLQNTQKVINDQKSDEIEGLKDLINEKQKDMDELIQNDMKKENQINGLIMRINNMEIQGAQNQDQLVKLETTVSELQTLFEALQKNMIKNTESIGNNTFEIINHLSNIKANTENIENNENAIANLLVNVNANNESIDALEQDSLTDRKEVMSLEILSKELQNNVTLNTAGIDNINDAINENSNNISANTKEIDDLIINVADISTNMTQLLKGNGSNVENSGPNDGIYESIGVWSGKCYECLAGECKPWEDAISIQCPKGTVACVRGSAENYNKKACGPKNRLPDGLIINGCVEEFGERVCTCKTDNCNKV